MKLLLVACLIHISVLANAENLVNLNAEISHLLSFIKTSGCTITRNGTAHEASDAVDHIQKKYNYFKDEINSTEQFILLSATKSTMSGKFYMVQCKENKSLKTQEWLLKELDEYRGNAPT